MKTSFKGGLSSININEVLFFIYMLDKVKKYQMSALEDMPENQTSTSRASNIERAKWRSKCREKLSEHIRKTPF